MSFPNIFGKTAHQLKTAANHVGSAISAAKVVDLGIPPIDVVPASLVPALRKARAEPVTTAKAVSAGEGPLGSAARGDIKFDATRRAIVAVSTDERGLVQWHVPAPGEVVKDFRVWVRRTAEGARKIGIFQLPDLQDGLLGTFENLEALYKIPGLKGLPKQSLNPGATHPTTSPADVVGLPKLILANDHVTPDSIAPGRTLIIIHGIIDRVYGFVLAPMLVWGGFLGTLQQMYGGRVYAFDHQTISESPEKNAAQLLKLLPAGLELDILCHSRGGLVTRCLLNQLATVPKVTVRNVVFMAAANQGSPLAERAHLADLFNVLGGLSATSPIPLFGSTLFAANALMLRIASAIATGIEPLPGIGGLVPGSPLIATLNTAPAAKPARCSFIRAHFDNTTDDLLKPLEMASDRGLQGVPSDLVVPLDSVVNLGTHTPAVLPRLEHGTLANPQGRWHHLNLLDSQDVRNFIIHELSV